jgi:hypothetical protein
MHHFENNSEGLPAHRARDQQGVGLTGRSLRLRPHDVIQALGRARSGSARQRGGHRKLPGLMHRPGANGHAVPSTWHRLRLSRYVPWPRQSPEDEF